MLPTLTSPIPELTWSFSARAGLVILVAPDGRPLSFTALAPLAEHLREREDPWGGFVRAASALGMALHAVSRARDGVAADRTLLEAEALLHALPVQGVLVRLRDILDRHRDILAPGDLGARLVLEARRLQREQAEAVTAAVEAVRTVVPAGGTLLLAWPGGPACDLGEGLLTGPLLACRQPGGAARDILVAGPRQLATQACAWLAGRAIAATALDHEAALSCARSGRLAAVLVRCALGEARAEPAAAELASLAARRGVPVIGIGVSHGASPSAEGLVPLPAGRMRAFIHHAPASS